MFLTPSSEFVIVIGPACEVFVHKTPFRSKFSWGTRFVPWADGRDNQKKNSISSWHSFYDMLPVSNSSKIEKRLRGIILKSQNYERAKDFCATIPPSVISSKKGADTIVAAVHEQDALSVMTEVYRHCFALLNTKRGPSELFRLYETWFLAQMSKFSSQSKKIILPKYFFALLLLSNASVDNSQRIVTLLSAVSQNSNAILLSAADTPADFTIH